MTKQPGGLDQAALIFERAHELAGDARQAYLDEACHGDAALRADILSMLEAEAGQGEFLSDPTLSVASPISEGPGTVFGHYKLLQLIGEGGFGVVYLAQQTEPVRRKVALKIIKLGMDTKQVIARFEAERQALAMMDHPNIARVFDAGATETGRPYFVMELVKGVPITEYCDTESLSTQDRLDLFIDVCHAVQHAHQKGIIHRDIKPSNVLVTLHDGKPVPKVIDFGIAKATDRELTDKTLFTEHHHLIGTPQYMSPEQAEMSGLDIDTRSDIYSLGVLLYELLTGTTPFDPQRLRSSALAEIQRIIREEQPDKPSTRLSEMGKHNGAGASHVSVAKDGPTSHDGNGHTTQQSSLQCIAQHRKTEPAQLSRQLRGDLDWMVMKCLEKDRTRRYETANGLAMDVRRYLTNEPVEAGPPSRSYRAQKFVQRNRTAVISASLVAAALVLGMIGMSVEADRANRAEAQAQQRAGELEEVVDFQQSQLAGLSVAKMGDGLRRDIIERRRAALELAGLDEEEVQHRLLEFEQSLDEINFTSAARRSLAENIFEPTLQGIEEQFAEQPLVQAQLLQSIATLLCDLQILDRAVAPQEQALQIRTRQLGDAHPDTLRSLFHTARLYYYQSRIEEAESCLRRVVETARRELGPEHKLTLNALRWLGIVLQWLGKDAEAAQCFREVYEVGRRVRGEDDMLVMNAMANLANALEELGNKDEAEDLYRECNERARRVLGNTDHRVLWTANNLGRLLRDQGRLQEAEPYLRDALEGFRRKKGDENTYTVSTMAALSRLLRQAGELEEAERLAAEAVARGRDLWPNEHPPVGVSFMVEHARALTALKRFEPAETELLEALAMFENPVAPIVSRDWLEEIRGELAEGITELYETWHAAEPGVGHSTKAAEWLTRLEALEPPESGGDEGE